MTTYIPPVFNQEDFHCPFCNVYAHQIWSLAYHRGGHTLSDFRTCTCGYCDEISIWLNEKMIHPDIAGAPLPHEDLPDEIQIDFNEARSILNKSPRGSAALLRLSLQKLMKVLGETGKNIDKDIGSLVQKGLPVEIQRALDIVRVVGNEAVHPGQLELNDDFETAFELFNLINLIVEERISRPKKIEAIYSRLPAGKLKGIEDRDKVNAPD